MLTFIVKGVIRDRSRSSFPVMVCAAGVFLVFFGCCFIEGSIENFIGSNANFATGHVKVLSYAASKETGGAPIDLALDRDQASVDEMVRRYPDFRWTRRTNFGALLDIPDEQGETKAQSPVACMALDLTSPGSVEARELKLARAVTAGRLPTGSDELVAAVHLAERLKLRIGEQATLMCSTADGSTTAGNFTVVGVVRLGIPMLDRNTVLLDVRGADRLLDMQTRTAELLGFRTSGFDRDRVEAVAKEFNERHGGDDEYRPVMLTLMDQNNLRSLLDTTAASLTVMSGLFVFLMTLVLWNAGLIRGIRRFSEVGVRLAIGERRRHIVGTMLVESLATGAVGTAIGILVGLPVAYYFQEVGVDYTASLKDFSMLCQGVIKARIAARPFVVAVLPGLLSSFLGMAMASIAIYQRKTASLFKELET